MSQIINKLFKHGYIKKKSSKTDKRKVIITITASRKKQIEKKRHEKEEWLAQSISEKPRKMKKKY